MQYRYFTAVPRLPEPRSLNELKERLELIKGRSLGELAAEFELPLPPPKSAAKGYAGELIELLLGANSQNLGVPDFQSLGIELKTLPIDRNFEPQQTTFLTHAPLTGVRGQDFYSSPLYFKLRLTLYIFILMEPEMSLTERRIIDYCLYAMPQEDLEQVKRDYDELMELVSSGASQQITARLGTIIQMRPKAADGRQLTDCVDFDGSLSTTRPRGFYLRRDYSRRICAKVSGRHQLPLSV